MIPLLEIKKLSVSYLGTKIRAVKDVSFTIHAKERVGLVGESGCGKTALMTAILGLDPAQRVEGSTLCNQKHSATLRGHEIGMVFQDPMSSLNPIMRIGDQIAEGLIYHRKAAPKEAHLQAIELLKRVGLTEPAIRARQYPHALSGGQRQRILIAIALACRPKLILADEPTTALDPSISIQILDLLKRLTQQLDMALLLVTHDLRAVASTCERVLVMHEGSIVEDSGVDELFYRPKHPYTKTLLNSLPRSRYD